MKKIHFAALLLFLHLTAQAQTEKGRWTAGVSVGSFSYQSNKSGHNFSSNLSPSVGLFIMPNFLVGLGVPLGFSSSKYTITNSFAKNTNTRVGLSPFARYYFGTSSLKPLVSLAVAYEYLNLSAESTPDLVFTTKGSMLQVTPAVGVAYFINRSISLDALLGYNWDKTKLKGSGTSSIPYTDSSEYITRNATLTIGFNIFFGQ